ncbi:MAG: HAD family hydrolase [Ktedonobacterales bacterium]
MIRAVFFDLDNTLLDSELAWRAAVARSQALLRARRPELTDVEVRIAWSEAQRALAERMDAGELRVAQMRERRWGDALALLGISDATLASEIEATLAREFLDGVRLFADAGVIERLRGRYHVGIITNGADDAGPDSQRAKALHTGLLDRVDSFLASDAADARKPDPRIFALALERAGVAPAEALYAGDAVESDVVGANRAGMLSVLLWRGPRPVPELSGEQRPARVIATLHALPALLDEL